MLVASLIALAGAGLGYANQQKALRTQNKLTTQGILQRQQAQNAENAAIQATTKQIAGNSAAGPVASQTQSYLSDLQNAVPSNTQQAPATGAMSDAYARAAGAANANVADKAKTAAGLMAVTDAPGIQRQGEQSLIGQLGINLNDLGINANDATNLTAMKVKGVQPNPWAALAAQAMQSYGMGKLASGLSTAGTTDAVNDPYIGNGSLDGTYSKNVAGLFGGNNPYLTGGQSALNI